MSEHERSPRHPIPIRVVYQRDDEVYADYAKDISLDGLFIRRKDPLPVNTPLDLLIRLPDQPAPLVVSGVVVRTRALPHPEASRGMGVHLDWSEDADRERFREFILTQEGKTPIFEVGE